jgi:Fur family ferric uptake transcriptional regulator
MYKTKHRARLLEFLREHPGEHITVGDLCSFFSRCGESIGTATVYRQMEKLVDEGIVNKYVLGAGSPACFEYVAEDEEHSCSECFHCKCSTCGRLIHLHCEELEEIERHLLTGHDFRLDPKRTVFYGTCAACSKR